MFYTIWVKYKIISLWIRLVVENKNLNLKFKIVSLMCLRFFSSIKHFKIIIVVIIISFFCGCVLFCEG